MTYSKFFRYTIPCLVLILTACLEENPNDNPQGEDELESLEIDGEFEEGEMSFYDKIYVPIYSDIYVDKGNQECLLAATLSIRNTSEKDSLFVSRVDYFNTNGNPVRSYLDKTIALPPMATVNYVIEPEDKLGGSGANFIIELTAKDNISKPVIQAVMIGEYSNKAFSFVCEGKSL